jgi:hypothetical protein
VAPERHVFDRPAPRRAERYLEAGNYFVDEAHDYASALRCYEQALAGGDASALEITPDDNWLVMALKIDQQRKEH